MNKAVIVAGLLGLLLTGIGCSPDDETASSCLNDYSPTPVLIRYADDVIVPAYEALAIETSLLVSATESFDTSPDEESLDLVRKSIHQTRMAWQKAAFFRFGPAETHALAEGYNLFPVNETQVKFSAQNQNYDYSDRESYNKGLPALEFLTSGIQSDTSLILDTLIENERYRSYIVEVAKDMNVRIQAVVSGWDNYRSEFIDRTGTSAGESLSLLVNGLNQHVETIKRNKVGIPSGVLSLGIPNPSASEAPYSKQSVAYLKESLKQLDQVFTASGSQGLDEVVAFTETVQNGTALERAITNQIDTCLRVVESLEYDMVSGVEEEKGKYTELFNQLNTLVVLLKSDMPSVMCISITYIDNPSDSD